MRFQLRYMYREVLIRLVPSRNRHSQPDLGKRVLEGTLLRLNWCVKGVSQTLHSTYITV